MLVKICIRISNDVQKKNKNKFEIIIIEKRTGTPPVSQYQYENEKTFKVSYE